MKAQGALQPKAGTGIKRAGWLLGKLQSKMIAWFLIVALIPMLGTATYIYNTSVSELVRKQTASYEKLVAGTATVIDQYLSQRMNEVKLGAATSDIKAADAAAKTRFIQSFTESTKVFDGNTFISPNGIVSADTNPSSVGVNLSERAFFKNGLEGKTTYTEVLVAKTTGKRSIIVAAPVRGENSKILGVFTGLVNFESLMDNYVGSLNVGNGTGYPIVVDSNGIIQLHPNKELIGKKVEEAGLSPALASILKMSNVKTGSTTYQEDGKTYLVAYSPIAQTDYVMYLHLPLSIITEEAATIKQNVWVIVANVAVAVSLFAYFLGRQISRPIAAVAALTAQVAQGDLQVARLPVRTRDEVGTLTESVNTMVDNLHAFVSQVTLTAEEVASSAEQLSVNATETGKATQLIAETVEQLAEGTDRQLSSVQVSVTSIQEIAEGVEQVTATAEHVTESAVHTSKTAQEGNQAIQTVIGQMESIDKTVSETAAAISRLGARSSEIENIVKAISAIAAQTNLLSLNAGIEAARAGEHGRGFAVVAGEIRKLAEQSSRSAGQISELVSTIQSETWNAVESMKRGTREVGLGMNVVHDAGKSFELIQQSINEVAAQIQEVTGYSRQMQSSTGQAVSLVKQISDVARLSADGTQNISASTQEQLASIEEVTSSAESLAKMAEDLQTIAKGFKL